MVRTNTSQRQESTRDSQRDTHRNWLKLSTNVGNCFVHQAGVPRRLFYIDDDPHALFACGWYLCCLRSSSMLSVHRRRHMQSCLVGRQLVDHKCAASYVDGGPAALAPVATVTLVNL